jgi:hypothetical protein
MSRKQGPHGVGMRPSAIAGGCRHSAFEGRTNFEEASSRAGSRGPAQWGCDRPRVLLGADTLHSEILLRSWEATA